MPPALPSAFKTMAEQISEELRAELGLRAIDALDPHTLLRHLELPVLTLTQLAASRVDDALKGAVAFLRSDQSLSAMTVFKGTKRMIVHNDHAPAGRQASDLMHEAAHGILLHNPAPGLDELGLRMWNDINETEADYLSGCLLITGKAVRYWAKAGVDMDQLADRFGTSVEMARWRYNICGGQRLSPRGARVR